MISVMQRYVRTAAALGALGLAFAAAPAHAVGTPADTTISNQATVSFSVGGVSQTPVTSPAVTFKVDKLVSYTVTTVDAALVAVTPGQSTGFVTFTLSHVGNGLQGFQLNATNLSGGTVFGSTDNADVTVVGIYVAPDNSAVFVPSSPTSNGYVLGNINALAADTAAVQRRVVVLVTAPTTLTNAQVAGIRLEARGAVPNTAGATLETNDTGPDTSALQTVIAVAGNSATTDSGFRVNAPVVTVAKTTVTISDPVNNTTNPKAIPGAVVEYRVTATNGGGGAAAASVGVSDTLQAETTFDPTLAYNTGTANVQIIQNSASTFCVAETGGTDTNGDGCVLSGNVLTARPTASGGVTLAVSGPSASAEFRFRVKVN